MYIYNLLHSLNLYTHLILKFATVENLHECETLK